VIAAPDLRRFVTAEVWRVCPPTIRRWLTLSRG
jgi:hypothetical protein